MLHLGMHLAWWSPASFSAPLTKSESESARNPLLLLLLLLLLSLSLCVVSLQ
jgi:hypothetical protein